MYSQRWFRRRKLMRQAKQARKQAVEAARGRTKPVAVARILPDGSHHIVGHREAPAGHTMSKRDYFHMLRKRMMDE